LRRRVNGGPSESDSSKIPLNQFGTLIQTDVRLQLGTSGGALLDLDGRLVGLTTSQAALTGVDAPGGFAVPLDANIRRIIDVLLRGEEVEYGFLGISVVAAGDMPRFGFGPAGLYVSTVVDNSPAQKAGLQVQDRIVRVNGQPMRDRDDLFLALATSLAGKPAELTIQRYGREETLRPVLVKAPIDVDHTSRRPRDETGVWTVRPRDYHGLRVEYTSVIKGENAIPPGVVVREATDRAKAVGLVPYEDIIVRVNGDAANSPADFYKAADKSVQAGNALELTLADGRKVTLP
jgi:serine protease Do